MVSIGVNVHDPPAPDFHLLESSDTDEASVVLKIGDVAIFAPGVEWLEALAAVATLSARQLEKENLVEALEHVTAD